MAILVVPGLVQNVEKKITVSKLQKMYSLLHQTVQRIEAEKGPITTVWRETLDDDEAKNDFNENFGSYLRIVKFCTTNQECGYNKLTGGVWYWQDRSNSRPIIGLGIVTVLLADGSLLSVQNSVNVTGVGTVTDRTIWYDVNGPAGPNLYGRDVFFFQPVDGYGIIIYGERKPYSEIQADCKKNTSILGRTCGAKIIRDGWQIKDDYPW